jgi:hypothetical protein
LAVVVAEARGTTTTDPPDPPPIPVVTSGGWSRDFNGPLDDNFLAMGFKFRGGSGNELQLAPTFQRSTAGGVLKLWDDVLPLDEGTHTALGADFSMAFDKVRIRGTINPLGLPPIPDGTPITGENSLGFVARGDLASMSTYYAAVDFRGGTLRMGDVSNGQVYFADHLVTTGPTLAERFADYKTRSYYLDFRVETYTGFDLPATYLSNFVGAEPGNVLLSAELYDQRGGDLLMSLYWADEYSPLTSPGVAGVFVQSFDDRWRDQERQPALFGSFDDVSAMVPEPAAAWMAVCGLGGLICRSVWRRRKRA